MNKLIRKLTCTLFGHSKRMYIPQYETRQINGFTFLKPGTFKLVASCSRCGTTKIKPHHDDI